MKKVKKDNLEFEIKSLRNRFIPKIASTIEMSFESFGIRTKVVEFNYHPDYIEFCLDLALGTPIEKVVKHHKDIAMAVCSITGDVDIEAPIPGRSLFSVKLPITDQWVRVQSDYYKKLEADTEKMTEEGKIENNEINTDDSSWPGFRAIIAAIFYMIADLLIKLGNLIRGRKNA